ncbi:Hint domain-containing protein [Mameliella alba]|uniref:Hemolysin-type calcium-binding region n=1 Tax=Mameliella alba TaxID=561184 RepID=A0A0B3RM61_9RHOB|nr:Hint domain-containing protein [Mameliella alba]KHQ52305.1 Hemolysin-type calcium-binding region [Mameliella alba]
MPSPDSYSYAYFLGTTPPDGSTAYTNRYVTDTTMTDGADGASNDTTTVGDPLTWTGTAQNPVTLYGFNADGDPIIAITGTLSTSYWVASNRFYDADGSVLVGPVTSGDYTYCFAAGTEIATPSGSRPVESLTIGDLVLTADGRIVPVKWLGRQALRTGIAARRAQMVRIRAGALGDGIPHRDLTVTADHGMILDGLVVNASAMVNGDSIDFVPLSDLPQRFTVYHVETKAHDVILANGAPAETFIDLVGRRAFDNFGEYLDLYGFERIIPEMPRPRISARRHLPAALRERLAPRAPGTNATRRSA